MTSNAERQPVAPAIRCRLLWLAGVAAALLLSACTTTEVVERPIDDELLQAKVLDILRQNPQVMIDAINAHQTAQQAAQEQARNAALQKKIEALDLATVVGDSPTRGAAARRLLLIEFSDFQCPFCGRAQEALRTFMSKHGAEVTMVFKHLPLSQIHPEAVPAARAAWAAQQQGRFWEYHDLLFTRQDALADVVYAALATQLGLDVARFNRDRRSEAAGAAIERDLTLARTLGLGGTPFFLLNREPINGAMPVSAFEAALTRARSALQPAP